MEMEDKNSNPNKIPKIPKNPKKFLKKLPDDVIILEDEKPIILTEDLGKKFEMAICLLYQTPFDGNYKYSITDAELLKDRLAQSPLLSLFPGPLKHTAKNGSQYDFTGLHDETIKLSAKTTKKDGKVCPQVIGQPSKKKFCEFFQLDTQVTTDQIKGYIETNIQTMLHRYFHSTFDCPILYYNEHTNVLQLIKCLEPVDWYKQTIEFSHQKKGKQWGESSTISINSVTIGEFQVHNHRDCIKFRWAFEKLLKTFPAIFKIVAL